MIRSLLFWLDHHPGSYWAIAFGPAVALLAWIGFLVRRESHSPAHRSSAGWRDAVVIFLFLLAWRWPFLLVADDLNPDESQQIAGAITLAHDPVFWRSVDGNTAGPLNFYALLPMRWLGLPLDYFSARLTGLLFITAALFFCLRTMARIHGRAPAWLGVLPAAAFFATVTHADFVHFSTEHLSLLLVTVSFGLLATREPADRVRLGIALFVAGSAPWAKLQTAPLALMLMGWGAWQILRATERPLKSRLQRVSLAVLWALAPTILFAGLAAATGQLGHVLHRYFAQNLIYVGQSAHRPALEVLAELTKAAMADGRFPLFLETTLAVLVIARIWFFAHRVSPPVAATAGGWLTLAAVIAVATPRREFLHYVLLLPLPLTLWMTAMVGGWWNQLPAARSRRLLAIGLVFLGGLLPLATRCLQPVPSIYGDFAYHWRHPRTSAAVVVHALAGNQGSLALWGWANRLYVETGLPQATRDATSLFSITPNPQRDYHRALYLADLRRRNPVVFVDAVGPKAFVFNKRTEQAHETFPELAGHIRQHYVLVTDLAEARIYARRDLATLAAVEPGRLDELISRGRLLSSAPIPVPPPVTPIEQYTGKIVERRKVLMLLPPSQMEWPLDAEVRQVTLEFGIDPVAHLQGASDGAEIILEVVSSMGQVRQVYRRLLDPARQPDDRTPQTAEVTLPPFGPDTRLVLRTTSGTSGNNAWDWLYLAALQLHRSPDFLPEQFPGFNPTPASAEAVTPGMVAGEEGLQLFMHAPSSLTYKLEGQSRLQFGYGFQPGAYTDGGNTDGATFRVELHQPGQASHILFERRLDPVRNPADRGPQRLDLPLASAQGGTRLVISVDPGSAGNAAWDWTYLGNLTLK